MSEPIRTVKEVLKAKIPPIVIPYFHTLWEKHPFVFTLSKSRKTKIGEFRVGPTRLPEISINFDLHPALFLVTLIHEIAHLWVFKQYGLRVKPHGREWKDLFKSMMEPVLHESVFPPELLKALIVHLKNPKATSFSDPVLTAVFKKVEGGGKKPLEVLDLPEGSVFSLNGKFYKKGRVRRTWVECHEISTRRKYLVSVNASIGEAQLNLF